MLATRARHAVVADAMVVAPVLHGPETSVRQAAFALASRHRHLLLIVRGRRLLGTVGVEDLLDGLDQAQPALLVSRLGERTVEPDRPLLDVHTQMAATGQRRRAVVDADGTLLGLLCLKRHGRGFCDDTGIAARQAESYRLT